MTRHVIDKPSDRKPEVRLREYLRLARAEAPNKASRELHSRPTGARSAARLRQYLRIDRGYEA